MKSLLQQFKEVLKDEAFQTENAEFGHMLCIPNNNPSGNILLVGLNPSRGKANEQDNIPFKSFTGRHWNPILDLVGSLVDETAYLDLFPLRMTEQSAFEQFDTDFRARVLEVTQKEIERLKPKLIIHLNAGSKYYWGPNGWMGYSFEKTSLPPIHGRFLYRIAGFNPACNHRINPQITVSNLVGSYIYFYRMLTSRFEKNLCVEDRLNHNDLETVWSWVKKHTPSPEK